MKKKMSFITTNCGGHLGNEDPNVEEDNLFIRKVEEEPLPAPGTIPVPNPDEDIEIGIHKLI
jgi:hypothetical protein